MPKSGLNVALKGLDDIFSTEESRQEEQREQVQQIPIGELFPFKNHPFKVLDDDSMSDTVESVKQYGVLSPLIARPRPKGGYEIISGHRRFHAAQLAGLDKIKVQVRDVDDDQAIIDMVDANIQREHISPMEKARAYAMKLEAISHQGERRQETSNQVGWKLESAHEVGQQAGDSGTQVRRYVRLNSLVPDLQKKVDSGTLKFNPAVELSYLTPDEQQSFLDYAEAQDCTPSLSQAQKLKAASKEGNLTLDKLEEIMLAQKPSVAPREPVLNIDRLRYIRESYKVVFTELLLDDDTRVGFYKESNGLLLWQGSYLTRSAESHLSWHSVTAAMQRSLTCTRTTRWWTNRNMPKKKAAPLTRTPMCAISVIR